MMKLRDLIEVLHPETDMTFEIVEETFTEGILAKDILTKYPHAKEYKVVYLGSGYYTENDETISTIVVEVSNKNETPRN